MTHEHGPRVKAACIQLTTGMDPGEGVSHAADLIRRAAGDGAQMIATPEMTPFMVTGGQDLYARAESVDADGSLEALRALAAELNVWLLIGSIAVRAARDRCANRSFLISPDGAVAASYDKMHMFDVQLEGGETYQESKHYRAGDGPVIAETPWGGLGLTICYDLRFPHLYRHLARNGASIISVPSAFTTGTGKAHWHVLLRARAIETGTFVLAPAQTGSHECGRKTYGHSLIVNPWGEVLADAGTEPGIAAAELNLAAVTEARRRLPTFDHERPLT